MTALGSGLLSNQISDLGAQAFVYRPGTETLWEITDEPGLGTPLNKYIWSSELFDGGLKDGTPEYYAGTFNVQPDLVGVFAGVVRLSALLDTGSFGDPAAILSLLGADFPKTLQSNGGEIHQYDFATAQWTQVLGPGELSLDDGDVGFREMTAYNDMLFAATSRGLIFNLLNGSENPAKIVVSQDGETWSELSGGPLDPLRGNSSIRSMVVVEDPHGDPVLLVGTENLSGAETWIYDQSGNWSFVAKFPGAPLTHAETVVFDGKIYLGTWAPYGLVELDLSKPFPTNLTDVTPALPIDDQGVMQIVEFGGYLYLGSVNYLGGTSLFRTTDPGNPESWEVITSDGFLTDGAGNELLGDELAELGIGGLTYTWQTAVVDGVLYIGDFNGQQGLLLKSEDGVSFEIIRDGEGNPVEFGSAAYGIRQLLTVGLNEEGLPDLNVEPNALIIGSADPFNEFVGLGEFWPPSGEVIFGEPAQFDLLSGGDAEDVIVGGAFADRLFGWDEDDILIGDLGLVGLLKAGPVNLSPGNDEIKGGDGDDIALGNVGDDILRGQAGEDLLIGGLGDDRLEGGSNIDVIFGDLPLPGDEALALLGPILQLAGLSLPEGEIDTLDLMSGLIGPQEMSGIVASMDALLTSAIGEGAADAALLQAASLLQDLANGDLESFFAGVTASAAGLGLDASPLLTFDDDILAGLGNDIVFAGLGDDDVNGQRGNDIVFGETGDDLLNGKKESDILFGGEGNDDLRGGEGDDFLNGGLGDDVLRGGSGANVFAFDLVSGEDILYAFQNGQDAIDLRDFNVDPADFASELLPAISADGIDRVSIDLTALGGEGLVSVRGLNIEDVDETDFWL
ncbi:MAG: hypothetical protein Kilf2KO_38120 [Rhodospirillales bacterium]